MKTIEVTDGEYEFLRDYGRYEVAGGSKKLTGNRAAKKGLRILIEEHLVRDYALRDPDWLQERFRELRR